MYDVNINFDNYFIANVKMFLSIELNVHSIIVYINCIMLNVLLFLICIRCCTLVNSFIPNDLSIRIFILLMFIC